MSDYNVLYKRLLEEKTEIAVKAIRTEAQESFDVLYKAGAPQQPAPFQTQDGRVLNRSPYPGAPVEWNQSYHPEDTKNLWAARWVNPVKGDHEYAYLEEDIQRQPQMAIHQQNALVDTRIPYFRKYINTLLKSPHFKDHAVAAIMMLLDQGHMRLWEVIGLTVGDYVSNREIGVLGLKKIHSDLPFRQVLGTLSANRMPEEPLFAVPKVDSAGTLDWGQKRRIGPHLITNLMTEIGIPLQALQTYHATKVYVEAMEHFIHDKKASWDEAHKYAMVEIASEMGHDLRAVDDITVALDAIESVMVDPIVVQTIRNNSAALGLGLEQSNIEHTSYMSVPHITSDLVGYTPSEEIFSDWLHTAPVHMSIQPEGLPV